MPEPRERLEAIVAQVKWLSPVLVVLAVAAATAQPLDPLKEVRLCGTPKRDASGKILRRADVLAAFQRQHPCPSTGLVAGPCPRWGKDHIIPLADGGCDSVFNLQWLPFEIKSAAGAYPKDRWERKINAVPPQAVELPPLTPAAP